MDLHVIALHIGTVFIYDRSHQYLVSQLTRRARENDGLNNLTQTVILLYLGLNSVVGACFMFCLLFCRFFYCVSPNSSVILIPRETDLLWLKLICEEGKKFIRQPVRWSIYWSFCANFRTQLGVLKWMKLSWTEGTRIFNSSHLSQIRNAKQTCYIFRLFQTISPEDYLRIVKNNPFCVLVANLVNRD